jgi:type IV secretory pathway TraG/TraD family ATPase VirD4
MEHLLRYAVLALLEQPHADLRDIVPLFVESDVRRQVISRISDPQVQAFWTREYPAMNYRTSADGVAPLANKLGALLSNPVARKALCAPDEPLRFRKLMDAQQHLVIDLGKGQLGADTANVMGGLLLASLVNAAFSRTDMPAEHRRPFILYVDEFHHFSTGVFADALSECRKYGLGAVLAQQYTTQTDRDVLDAIFGNVGTLLALRVGALDAPMIARQLVGVTPEQLILQPSYRAIVQMILQGQKQVSFSADLYPPRWIHRQS